MSEADTSDRAPLAGLRVLDFSQTMAGALTTLMLGDCGAEVIHVEPPGGSSLREQAAFPMWQRGKKSIVLDLKSPEDLAVALKLAAQSDVLLESWRPGVADRLGIGYDVVGQVNPALVYCSLTGFGAIGPFAQVKGYEAIVMAKTGVFGALQSMVGRPGPAFAAMSFATYGGAQTAAHGILAALLERERSGAGQRVEASLAQGLAALDPCYWFVHVLAQRWPGAFEAVEAITEDHKPNTDIALKSLVGLTKDGHWLQFSQVQMHLFKPFMHALGLGWMFEHPDWSTVPVFDTLDKRVECWNLMLEAARKKTLSEWQEIMDADRNIWAEQFLEAEDTLRHPQLEYNKQVVEIEDLERGRVRQLGSLVQFEDYTPDYRSAPTLNQDDEELRALAAQPSGKRIRDLGEAKSDLPLKGVTVMELGIFFAGPFGATVLTDLGARVIKLEPVTGDPLRHLLPVPEIGGVKVLQGKETVAVDIATPEGREIVYALVKQADIVLQSYRGGVARRLGFDAETLQAINPDLAYLNAVGYGADGPYRDKPAFGTTIGAAVSARKNLGGTARAGADLTMDEVKAQSMRLYCAASAGVVTCDGLGGLGAGTGLLVGLLAKARGKGAHTMVTSMLCSSAYAVSDDAVSYPGRRAAPLSDEGLHGCGALYRLYESSDGWIFLAAPTDREWAALTGALLTEVDLGADERFGSAEARERHDAELIEVLASVFSRRSGLEWEQSLTAADVACVVAETKPTEGIFMSAEFGRASGYVADVVHPVFDEIPRLAPLVRFSRSETVAPTGTTIGQYTYPVLKEAGYTDQRIVELLAADIICCDLPAGVADTVDDQSSPSHSVAH